MNASRGPGRFVIQIPYLETPVIAPAYPMAIDGIVPVLACRERKTGLIPEIFFTVFAITDRFAAKPRPIVVRKTLRVIKTGDLGEDGGNMFVIIGTIDTGDIKI